MQTCVSESEQTTLQLRAEQQRGVRGAVHQPGGVPDAGREEAEQGRRRVPRQHPVAEELLAPRLMTVKPSSTTIIFLQSLLPSPCLVPA